MTVIDKRSLPGQSDINRDRFKKRYDGQIRKAVEEAIKGGSITDGKKGGVDLPIRGTSEPRPQHAQGGIHEKVFPGNHDFSRGDKIQRPQGGGGGGGSKAGQGDDTQDDFLFHIDEDEFLDYFLGDLELPNLVKQHLTKDTENLERVNAGITNDGPPPRLSIPRTYQIAYPRMRIFKRYEKIAEIRRLTQELNALLEQPEELRNQAIIDELEKKILSLKRKLKAIPFFDPSTDLRYHTSRFEPAPIAQAVMFCVMDVSGSMDEEMKDLAKRFFRLLYLFIRRNYKRVQVVFVRHTTDAEEVDEETFFYDQLSGGTKVSTALVLTEKIIKERYNPLEWNIYVAQASDGDNWDEDGAACGKLLNVILPISQYFAYLEISSPRRMHPPMTTLWKMYHTVYSSERYKGTFEMRKVGNRTDIFPVFRELFKKRGVTN